MADSCQCMTKPLLYCKVISLQLIKINGKKKNVILEALNHPHATTMISTSNLFF